jgi:uncharacterized protein
MSASMYDFSVAVFARSLRQLSLLLDKAAAFAAQKKVEPAVLLGMRLAPDMFPLLRQVRIACDFAKGASARLAGQEVPQWEDHEVTIDDLKARITRTLEFIESLPRAAFDEAAGRSISITMRGETVGFIGQPYLAHFAMPNFFFHMTTAYAILRHAGVEIGKTDFIGPR